MHTEDEAKQKWCPFTRVYDSFDGSAATANRGIGGRPEPDEGNTRCIASGCMAWEWVMEVPPSADNYEFITVSMPQPSTTVGDCGLKRRTP